MSEYELTLKESEALRFIRNSLIHGRSPSVRDIQAGLGYQSPRSAAVIIEKLMKHGWIERRTDGGIRILKDLENAPSHARTVLVPLVGNVACGAPLLAEENIEALIAVSAILAKPSHRHFLLRAKGDSMDRIGINDGDLVLVRQQQVADSGDIVVALIDDAATVKEFQRRETVIVLKPNSNSPEHKPLILTRDFQIQGVVITTIPNVEVVEGDKD
jgi:repressor LexA